MHAVIGDLYATNPHPLPFAPSLDMHAFLCRRARGNLLVYATPGLERETTAMRRLGGVSRQYLNHRHELEFRPAALEIPAFIHDDDSEAVGPDVGVVGSFAGRHALDDDFEAIPTPGHTAGATAYLWNTGEHRVLFTGDTIYLSEGEWVAAVLESSDRASYVASLELMRGLDFDVLVPWIATRGQAYHAVTDAAGARRRIDAILRRVRRGERR